ncbi:MAG: hypothetical protein IJI16_05175 [Atopobiaceae bacterium]|nr:hypothetical protein [Atopobiaceae bacterium]
MDVMDVISKRISCRAFSDLEVEGSKLDLLAAAIEAGNEQGEGIRMVLVRPEDGGGDLRLTPAMFSGQPTTYIALIGNVSTGSRVNLGYYGEEVVLLATDLGLSTCWVCGTYDKKTVNVPLAEGEVLHGVIPIGYAPHHMPLKQRTIRAALRRRDKKPQAVYAGYDEAPEWKRAAIDAVIAGPSAVNGQPIVFEDTENGDVATIIPKVKSGMEWIDLGIAGCHFELAAAAHGAPGTWLAGGFFHVGG